MLLFRKGKIKTVNHKDTKDTKKILYKMRTENRKLQRTENQRTEDSRRSEAGGQRTENQ